MRGRFRSLKRAAALAGLLLALFPALADAHRLDADFKRLPDGKIQIEGWYNSATGDHPAARSRVVVRRTDGSTFQEGELDERGCYTFAFDKSETLTVEVSNPGHFKSIVIPALQPGAEAVAPGDALKSERTAASPKRGSEETIKDGLTGVAFLLAFAAFVLSVRNARALRRLQDGTDSKGESRL